MVRWYHLIISAYGFWLPNDPRGSWSGFVGSWELFRFGEATKISTRKSVARVEHDRSKRLAAKEVLKYPPVKFNGIQANGIANAFAQSAYRYKMRLYACAILPE